MFNMCSYDIRQYSGAAGFLTFSKENFNLPTAHCQCIIACIYVYHVTVMYYYQ